jgi:hypothetical protein
MPISETDKNDIILTVEIELERMFTVLSNRFNRISPDESLFLQEIENALKATLTLIE